MEWTYLVLRHETSWIPAIAKQFQISNSKNEVYKFVPAEENKNVDFVWFHTSTNTVSQQFGTATVRGGNAVYGTEVLENKFSLALLLQNTEFKNLKSVALLGSQQVKLWCQIEFLHKKSTNIWMIKDAGANCGDGLYVTSSRNWSQVINQLEHSERAAKKKIHFVVQEYIEKPHLWKNQFKYHVRLYLVLTADGGLFLFPRALLHVANKPYNIDSSQLEDQQVHLTNVSKNFKNKQLFQGCPVIEVVEFFKDAFLNLKALFVDLMRRFSPFMLHQDNAYAFSQIGVDVMMDSDNFPYLLECNVPPCIGNYGSDMPADHNKLLSDMFLSMIDTFVVPGLAKEPVSRHSNAETSTWLEIVSRQSNFKQSSSTGFNNLAWRIFEKRALKKQENY